MSDIISKIDRGIKFLFYALFFLTPLALYPKTFELFEFNKLWTVFALSIVILFLWVSKMIISQKIIFKRTPFDIPIALFLASQIISTIFSIDPHVSFWGYYSRFNGGLLSLTTYIFLYYAFVSNFLNAKGGTPEETFDKSMSYKILFISLLSGFLVAAWGFTSHFGHDLTCLVFRNSFDVSCWTDAFQPTVRMFSTLGQPNWLAAYFSILIPVSLAIGIYKYTTEKTKQHAALHLLLTVLLFMEVLWTGSQSGFVGLLCGLLFFAGSILFLLKNNGPSTGFKLLIKPIVLSAVVLVLLSFFLGNPLQERFPFASFNGVKNMLIHAPASVQTKTTAAPIEELGGSDSGKIRLVVWGGALKIFEQHPLFGTGVETFAYAYYQVKPKEHNLLSEWDYLYNKAHNEYLNYLATTGIFGLGTYLLMIGWFIWYCVKNLLRTKNNLPADELKTLLILALLASYISILVSNFFGFSVVVINMYFFFIPAVALGIIPNAYGKQTKEKPVEKDVTPMKLGSIIIVGIVCLYGEFNLLNFWTADQGYSMGYNLDRAQQYVTANQYLEDSVKLYPGEDLYKNELSLNIATLGLLLYQQKQSTQAAAFVQRALQLSDEVVAKHPHNVVFYKTRIQAMYELSEVDEKYFTLALTSINTARILAPTDAKLAYNEGLLYGQKEDLKNAKKNLEEAIYLKSNYRDARYALASYLIREAKKETGPEAKQKLLDQAKANLTYNLQNVNVSDPQSKELLKSIE